jgi:hypothetical protein
VKFKCRNGHRWKSASFHAKSWERMCPECNLSAEPSLKGHGGNGSATRRHESPAERLARQEFNRLVCEWPCWAKDHRPGHTCRGPKDAHHLVPKSWIADTFADLSEPALLEIKYAPIIGAPACRIFHDALENRSQLIHWHELDPECIEFCERIDEKYPARPSMLARLELESPQRKQAATAAPQPQGGSQ